MQILGLSESTPRTESRLQSLFWPRIRSEGDFEYITRQGFWICLLVATLTFAASAFTRAYAASALEGTFFFLAGVGVRERSRAAAITAFSAYFLAALVLQRYTGSGFGIVRIIFLALLFANIRGSWLSSHWEKNWQQTMVSMRLNTTLVDKLIDQLPTLIWPKAKFVFYVLAFLEISLLLVALLRPVPLPRIR